MPGGVKATRQSNFELLRICAMMMVLFVHSDFLALKPPTVAQTLVEPGGVALRIFVEMLCIASVNIFVMISGYFAIRPMRKNVFNFVFILIFWRVLIEAMSICAGTVPPGRTAWLFILPGYSDWFVQNYLLLMLLAPAANALIDKWSKRKLRAFLIIFFSVELTLGWLLMPWYDSPFNRGYSIVSFVGLYLLARYIRLYVRADMLRPSRAVIYFVGLASICSLIMWLSLRFKICHEEVLKLLIAYSGIPAIPLAVIAVCGIRTLKLQSNAINSLAGSAFVIYLVHFNPLVINHFIAYCRWLYKLSGIWCYFVAFLVSAIVFYLGCWSLDRLRLRIWDVWMPRLICKVRGFSLISRK